MKHSVKISVSREPPGVALMRCRKVTVRERFLRWMLGEKRMLTVIIPGHTIETVSIEELPGKGGGALEPTAHSG